MHAFSEEGEERGVTPVKEGPLILERRGAKAKAERLNVPTRTRAERAQRDAVSIHRRWTPEEFNSTHWNDRGPRKVHLLRLQEGEMLSEVSLIERQSGGHGETTGRSGGSCQLGYSKSPTGVVLPNCCPD